eukprot:Gb_05860 [translate_table: standard]
MNAHTINASTHAVMPYTKAQKSNRKKLKMDPVGHGNGVETADDSCNEDSKEQSKLHLMRRNVEGQHPFAKAVDDATLRRFLRARDLNVEKASQLFLKYLKWRQAFAPLGYIPETEVSNELEKKKIFMQGLDKQRRPIGVILAARHVAFDRDLEEFKRLVVYGFDKICASMPRGQEKFVIIADLDGWGYRNSDVRAYLIALQIMQDYFPERLGKVFMIHVPYLFWAAWKMVYPFIDKVTKKKIIFVEDKLLKATLLNDIDESQLPEIYGGKLSLVPIQDCATPNWPPALLS